MGAKDFRWVGNPSVPNPPSVEEDLNEFFTILALDSLDAQEALVRKISIRRA